MKRVRLASENGFTLIEVLVALVILSIGLLGVAGMQTRGLQTNNNAYLRSVAQQSACEVLDMMRANRNAAISATYTENYNLAADKDPAAEGKTGVALADLQEWRRGFSGNGTGLPGGTGAIAVTANPDNTWTVAVTIAWIDNRYADDNRPTVVLETKL